ncbi:hypothetical protein [Mesorhizobium sp. ORM16]|uniref:hypothetical protein n=1 Tax=Mesorhizobium sp. ORM16 TaxID=3376989 RepID=UPI003857913E
MTLNCLFLLSALSFYNLAVHVVITYLQLYRILRVGRSESPPLRQDCCTNCAVAFSTSCIRWNANAFKALSVSNILNPEVPEPAHKCLREWKP